MRKIAIITGTRAEYGLLYWIIKGICDAPDLELQLIVTGMHLCSEFGLTVKEIENDGFPITERVDMPLSSDTEKAISTSMGRGMIGFAETYEKLKPDILLVLGTLVWAIVAIDHVIACCSSNGVGGALAFYGINIGNGGVADVEHIGTGITAN